MRKNHLFSSCELMSDLSADILFVGEEAFCCICIGHDCEKATDKDSLTVEATTEQSSVDQDVGWPPPGTRISKMNTDGKWEEVK